LRDYLDITIILPVVLSGHETWSLKLKDEHRLRAFENRALKIIFESRRDEVIGSCRKLHNEKLHNFALPSIYGSTVFLLDLRPFFSFSTIYTVGRNP
jgi:hypothetical protein